jgi:hypothetical protein
MTAQCVIYWRGQADRWARAVLSEDQPGGTGAQDTCGLSASSIARLKEAWVDEHAR